MSEPVLQTLTRKPPYILANELVNDGFNALSVWNDIWKAANLENGDLILGPSAKVPGFDLARVNWTQLNRIQTGHGRCNRILHQWGAIDDPSCVCGFPVQDVHHIVSECSMPKYPGPLLQMHNVDVPVL